MTYQDYSITPAKSSPNLYEIRFNGSGKVADCLTGLFTSTGMAKDQIDAYLNGRLTKRSKNAQTVD